jgi:hypothetical protein
MFYFSHWDILLYRPADGESSESEIRMTYTEYDIEHGGRELAMWPLAISTSWAFCEFPCEVGAN